MSYLCGFASLTTAVVLSYLVTNRDFKCLQTTVRRVDNPSNGTRHCDVPLCIVAHGEANDLGVDHLRHYLAVHTTVPALVVLSRPNGQHVQAYNTASNDAIQVRSRARSHTQLGT